MAVGSGQHETLRVGMLAGSYHAAGRYPTHISTRLLSLQLETWRQISSHLRKEYDWRYLVTQVRVITKELPLVIDAQ